MEVKNLTKRIPLSQFPFGIAMDDQKTEAYLYRANDKPWELNKASLQRLGETLGNKGFRQTDMKGLVEAIPDIIEQGKMYCFSRGKKPENGKHGYVKCHFESNPAEKMWQEDEDSRIDFRELNKLNNVKEGELLAELVPPTPHTDGLTVFGQPIHAKKGKPAKMKAGPNVRLSEDEQKAFSEIDGCVKMVRNRLAVDKVHVIRGDVNFKSGNVTFKGDVRIFGDVRETFSVDAEGSIYVQGMVDRAELRSGADITVEGGIYGKEDVSVEAEGNVTVGFAENANLHVKGDLYARTALVNCEAWVDGVLHLKSVGKALIGGHIIALQGVEANSLGNPRIATKTIVEFGLRPELLQKMRQLKFEFEQAEDERRIEIREELEICREEYEKQAAAKVKVQHNTYPGVVFKTGKISYDVRNEISSMIFYKVEGKNEISMRSCGKSRRR